LSSNLISKNDLNSLKEWKKAPKEWGK
jgi:hypothetical protein